MPIAMHLEIPTIITPRRYFGELGSVAQAKPSISNGPIIQLRAKDIARCIHISEEEKIVRNSSYCTLVRTGHIMTIRPTAMAV